MDAASLKDLKNDLKHLSHQELLDVCLRLTKHKKENKELLTYLIYWKEDGDGFIEYGKEIITDKFREVNYTSFYFAKKNIRKILSQIKKLIRFAKQPNIEAELLLHFCSEMNQMPIDYKNNVVMYNMFLKQTEMIEKAIGKLHEDLQYDYQIELNSLFE